MLSFFRVIKFSLQDIMRNFSLSFMTVLILVLMLFSVNAMVVVNVLTTEAVQTVKSQIDVSVFFVPEVSSDQTEEIEKYVNSFPEVTEIIFYSREQVLEQFKEQHKNDAEILASLEELGDNPLGPTMIIKTREPSDYQKIISALNVPEYENYIEAKTFADTEKAIQRIDIVTTQVEKFAGAMSILFAVIAFFIIFNTIRVAIYTQKTEISIKKLVGASSWFVRGPYIIESLIFSIISVAIAYFCVQFGLTIMDPYLEVVFDKALILTNYYQANILLLLSIQFGTVLFLTIVSSLLAMRRHLKV